MDDMIKEVVNYVSPKAVIPEVQTKTKAPAKKMAAEEMAPVDPYAGQDTKAYKEIGNTIK
jgi:hypothetical protein